MNGLSTCSSYQVDTQSELLEIYLNTVHVKFTFSVYLSITMLHGHRALKYLEQLEQVHLFQINREDVL